MATSVVSVAVVVFHFITFISRTSFFLESKSCNFLLLGQQQMGE